MSFSKLNLNPVKIEYFKGSFDTYKKICMFVFIHHWPNKQSFCLLQPDRPWKMAPTLDSCFFSTKKQKTLGTYCILTVFCLFA